ncbi:SDR family oxidoreductase [Streptomyces sp. DHE17-7]|uniref:SDR family oxidoreductase n=1 Tax=Streptomyces sp. DHE17-7 TaxID=2759949 RepID=UPI003FA6ECED
MVNRRHRHPRPPSVVGGGQDGARPTPRPRDGVTHVTGDLLTGEGVEAAVAGAHTVLHLAGGPKGDDVATRALVGAARGADVRHLVYISVVGADRVPLAWLRTKLESERAVADSGIPWTVLPGASQADAPMWRRMRSCGPAARGSALRGAAAESRPIGGD